LQFLLRVAHILAGLLAHLAKSRQFLCNRLGRGIFTIQRRAQIRRSFANRRRRLLIGSAATTTAWTATARAAATEPAKAESAARFALRRHHFVHLGLDRLPLLIRRAKLLFDAAHHALAHLRRIKIASSLSSLASGLAIVLILGK